MLLRPESAPVIEHALELLAFRGLLVQHLLERVAQRPQQQFGHTADRRRRALPSETEVWPTLDAEVDLGADERADGVALGEEPAEIEQTLRDIAADKTDILTIGQYLQPSTRHLPVSRWVTPEEFAHWKSLGLSLGLGVVESGPLVRSSYHADEQSQKYTGEEHLNRTNALAGT